MKVPECYLKFSETQINELVRIFQNRDHEPSSGPAKGLLGILSPLVCQKHLRAICRECIACEERDQNDDGDLSPVPSHLD